MPVCHGKVVRLIYLDPKLHAAIVKLAARLKTSQQQSIATASRWSWPLTSVGPNERAA
jgi:hypothetical protein